MNALALSWSSSISFLFFLFMSVCFFEFFQIKSFCYNKDLYVIFDLEFEKHSQYIPLLAYHLNIDTNYS